MDRPIRNVKTRTPWGKADFAYDYGPGVIWYSTPGHGGFHLSKQRNELVHPAWRDSKGWYEEDDEWAVVAFTFPELFDERERASARQTLREWRPFEWEQITGDIIPPDDSHVKREVLFKAQHMLDWVGIAAFGDHHPGVPSGMVGVLATQSGERARPAWTGSRWVTRQPAMRWFLVPEAEYDNRHEFGFVVDPSRHQEVGPLS